jgi:hypothetical protein
MEGHEPQWRSSDFQKRKRSVARYLRGLDALAAAKRAIKTLIAEWANPSDEIKSALHTAAVINYARPFGQGAGLPSKILKSEGFDRDLHGHILQIRDKLVAHSDTQFLQARVLHTVVAINLDGARIPIPLNISAHVKALHLLADIELAKRYDAHIGAALKFLYAKVNEMLVEIQTAALTNPEEALHTPEPGRIIGYLSRDNKIESGMPFPIPPLEGNELATIPPPQLTAGNDGYMYRQISMTANVLGAVHIRTSSGISKLTIGADTPASDRTNG